MAAPSVRAVVFVAALATVGALNSQGPFTIHLKHGSTNTKEKAFETDMQLLEVTSIRSHYPSDMAVDPSDAKPSAAECPGERAHRGRYEETGKAEGGFFKNDPCPCSLKLLKPESMKSLPDQCHPESSLQNSLLEAASRVQMSGGAMALRMYRYIAATIKGKGPANLLVFSVGNDSPLWKEANQGGRTLFKEKSKAWRDIVLQKQPDLDIDIEDYFTMPEGRGRDALLREVVSDPRVAADRLTMKSLPDTDDWHTIIVDGPLKVEGRMQPLYMASLLACKTLRRSAEKPVDVFVHDADRRTERTWSDALLGVQNKTGFRVVLWPEANGHFPKDGGSAPLRHYRFDSPEQIPLCSLYK